MDFIVYFIVWIIFALIVASVGEKRKIGFAMALLLSLLLSPLIGFIIVLSSDKISISTEIHKFQTHIELGKKAEYKGQFHEAINHYMDTLYHLENDYINLPKNENENRLKQIDSLKQKVAELRKKVE